MKASTFYLHNVSVTASTNTDASEKTYSWNQSHPVEFLESVVAKIQSAINDMKAKGADPLAAQRPIVTDDPALVFQSPK